MAFFGYTVRMVPGYHSWSLALTDYHSPELVVCDALGSSSLPSGGGFGFLLLTQLTLVFYGY